MIEDHELRDHIRINHLEVGAHLGVPDDERSAPKRFTFSITLWPLRAMSDLDDQIERAVNYAAVCVELKEFVGPRRDKLIETLADALAAHLLEAFEIRRITIELRKAILLEVEFVSVTKRESGRLRNQRDVNRSSHLHSRPSGRRT